MKGFRISVNRRSVLHFIKIALQ